MQIAPFQRLRTLRADRWIARRHVVHQHKFHFNGHLTDPYLAVGLRAPAPSLTLGSCLIPTSVAVLHASVSSAHFSLRQVVISSAAWMGDATCKAWAGRMAQLAPPVFRSEGASGQKTVAPQQRRPPAPLSQVAASTSYQRRVRTTHQVITRLSKSWEQHQR